MKRSEIREHIFKLVFCGDFYSSSEIPEQVERYFADLPEATQEEHDYMAEKFGHIKDQILRLAVYEMLHDDEVPVKVAINEAVELAKKYGGDDSPSFVNGVLAKLA